MSLSFQHLTPEDAASAVALVRLVRPDFDETAWLRYLEDHASEGAGTVGLIDERGYFYAIFSYRTVDTLRCGRSLVVEDVVLAQLPGMRSVRHALTDAIDALAERAGCEQICIAAVLQAAVPVAIVPTLQPFHSAGFSATGVWMTKIAARRGRRAAPAVRAAHPLRV